MDLWKYFAIGHSNHDFMNPMSGRKFDEMIERLALPSGARVLDIACGKAEFLLRSARRWRCRGVGVELSPLTIAEARAAVGAAGLANQIELVEVGGADYEAAPASFDLCACIGASWIWEGHAGTLEALASWTKPGGLVLVGEPHWRKDPSDEHLASTGMNRHSFGSHRENIEAGSKAGLAPLYSIVSSYDDWDRYEGLQWNAIERYAHGHADDPELRELLQTMRAFRDKYLRWGRDELGWALYLFLKS